MPAIIAQVIAMESDPFPAGPVFDLRRLTAETLRCTTSSLPLGSSYSNGVRSSTLTARSCRSRRKA